ncbi:class I SAM-dependent methyltransferase [Microbaculum sp. FT89]|uniref:class I SAM-dependent methyltransferase n=1 Tax=Microbaculum sp. FT89 TaxID=3447298 RepID=UPI003F531B6C
MNQTPPIRRRDGKLDSNAVRKAYKRWAPVYDELFGSVTRAARRAAIRHINTSHGRVLEVGVGTGIALPLYAGHLEVVGIDLSLEMLEQARRRVTRQDLSNVSALLEMDAGQLGFADASFDAVVAMHVVTVAPEPKRVMAELERVCRPGGEVILVNHFSAQAGPRAAIEQALAPFADRLGWRPEFPVETVLDRPGLEPIERRGLPPAGLFTMLRFRRIGGKNAESPQAMAAEA